MKTTRPVKLHETLKELIETKGYSRNRKIVCNAVGISSSALTQYIQQQTNPSLDTLVKLASFFEVSLDYLVFGTQSTTTMSSVDYGHMYHYMDQSLADLQAKTDQQAWMFARVSRVLMERIKNATREVVGRSDVTAGMLQDKETILLEQYSVETLIVSLNLQYDMKDADTPGRFMETVAKNLTRRRKYRFVLPSTRDWQTVVSNYLHLLQKQCGNDQVVLENCKFKCTTNPLIAGCVFYHLDTDSLKKDHPILYEMIHDAVDENSWLGYILPPSKQLQADALMDIESLDEGLKNFESLWRSGKPIEKPKRRSKS